MQELDQNILNNHYELSQASGDFVQYMVSEPERLVGAQYRIAKYTEQLTHKTVQYWPTLVDHPFRDALAKAAISLKKLFCAVPERIFKNDAAALVEYFRMSPPFVQNKLLPNLFNIHRVIGRGDFLHTAQGFKCIEFNFGGNLGGFDGRIMAKAIRRDPLFQKFSKQTKHKFRFRDPVNEALRHMIQDTHAHMDLPDQELNLCAISTQLNAEHEAFYNQLLQSSFQRILTELPGTWKGSFNVKDLKHIRSSNGSLYLGGTQLHAVWEFTDTKLTPDLVLQPCSQKKATLYNGPAGMLLSTKLLLAALSERENSPLFSEEEQSLIRQYLPWTRKVARGESHADNQPIDLPQYIAANRETLVLKPADGHSAEGVTIGRFTDTKTWEQVIKRALSERNWIVQEAVIGKSLYYHFQDTCIPHSVIWGPFVFGDTLGGIFMRVQPQHFDSPISSSSFGAGGVLLEVSK